VLTGVRVEAGAEADLTARVEQIARGLATALENAQLLDDVVQSRQQMAEIARRLAQTEKMVALGQFVAGIAHELNNPLQGVLGHLELLRASANVTPTLKRDLGLVHREADRAARIVRHLLVFAGSGRLRARPTNLNTLVARVLRLRADALRSAGIEVVRDLTEGLPLVRADSLLLHQAILNVVMNAEQAMSGGGRLTVRSSVDESNGVVKFIVQDSGPGLTEAVRSRLFEPFFTTKDVGEGTGMGLAIAFGILKAHGGTIEAENHPSGGARFSVAVPSVPARG
jgi:signal transduction histidine kinase